MYVRSTPQKSLESITFEQTKFVNTTHFLFCFFCTVNEFSKKSQMSYKYRFAWRNVNEITHNRLPVE